MRTAPQRVTRHHERDKHGGSGTCWYVPPTSRQAAEYSLTAHSHLLAWRSPEGEMGGGRRREGRGRGGSIFTVSTAGLNGESKNT